MTSPDRSAYFKEYRQRPEAKKKIQSYQQAYRQRPEIRDYIKAYQRNHSKDPAQRERKRKYIAMYTKSPIGKRVHRRSMLRKRINDGDLRWVEEEKQLCTEIAELREQAMASAEIEAKRRELDREYRERKKLAVKTVKQVREEAETRKANADLKKRIERAMAERASMNQPVTQQPSRELSIVEEYRRAMANITTHRSNVRDGVRRKFQKKLKRQSGVKAEKSTAELQRFNQDAIFRGNDRPQPQTQDFDTPSTDQRPVSR